MLRASEMVHKRLSGRGLTIAAAESCTGGLLSHMLTSMPGASGLFELGIVAYSLKIKRDVLGVPPDVLNDFGMVSPETARAMACRVRDIADSDIGIATTGNLGPSALESKNVGLVYVSVCDSERCLGKKLGLTGTRLQNRDNAVHAALLLVLDLALEA